MAFIPPSAGYRIARARRIGGVPALACLLLVSGAAAAPTAPGKGTDAHQQDIEVDAESIIGDYKAQTTDYKNVVIRQDDIKVQADRAHAVGAPREKSEWTFEGNVRVQSEKRGSLHSDEAVVEIQNNRLTRVTVNGMPAEFEQKRDDSDQTTHGHANEIVYDVSDGTVRLSKDAWLSLDIHNEISSELLVYDIREQKLQASAPAGTDGRVHMTISPSGKVEPKRQP